MNQLAKTRLVQLKLCGNICLRSKRLNYLHSQILKEQGHNITGLVISSFKSTIYLGWGIESFKWEKIGISS